MGHAEAWGTGRMRAEARGTRAGRAETRGTGARGTELPELGGDQDFNGGAAALPIRDFQPSFHGLQAGLGDV